MQSCETPGESSGSSAPKSELAEPRIMGVAGAAGLLTALLTSTVQRFAARCLEGACSHPNCRNAASKSSNSERNPTFVSRRLPISLQACSTVV